MTPCLCKALYNALYKALSRPSVTTCEVGRAGWNLVLRPRELHYVFPSLPPPDPGRPPLLICQYWVPRIQLLFCAEDPRVFTQRVVQANALRKNTEALLLYNLYVDCMPSEGQRLLSEPSLGRIKQWAMSTPRMRKGPS